MVNSHINNINGNENEKHDKRNRYKTILIKNVDRRIYRKVKEANASFLTRNFE